VRWCVLNHLTTGRVQARYRSPVCHLLTVVCLSVCLPTCWSSMTHCVCVCVRACVRVCLFHATAFRCPTVCPNVQFYTKCAVLTVHLSAELTALPRLTLTLTPGPTAWLSVYNQCTVAAGSRPKYLLVRSLPFPFFSPFLPLLFVPLRCPPP